MTARYFTVSEANGQVAVLAQHFGAVMQIRGQLKTLYRKLDDAGYPPDDDLDEDGSIDLDDDAYDDGLELDEGLDASCHGDDTLRSARGAADASLEEEEEEEEDDTELLEEFEDVPQTVIRDHAVFRALVDTLRDRVTEIREMGCVIKDLEVGLVDWRAEHEGREIWLCWKYGERDVGHWHSQDEGFSARQPISTLDGVDAGQSDRRS